MRWMKHTAMVPKGFLRYKLLKLISEKAMSGSEIMREIDEQTNGVWKPSPGSIYPLLAWLQDNGYINEVASEEGIKRYIITENGRVFQEELEKTQKKIGERFAHMGPGPNFMGPAWNDFFPNKSFELLRKPAIKIAVALWDYHR